MEKVIKEASKWVGYLEKKSNKNLDSLTENAGGANYTLFAEEYKKYWGENYQAQPWCAVFVSVIFMHAYKTDKVVTPFAYCPTGVNNFKKKNAFFKTPEKGDIIFFTNGKRAYHTGLVIDTDGKKVYTIEGNTSAGKDVIENGGGVSKKSYLLTNSKILGYGRPDYKEAENMANELKELDTRIKKLENPMIYGYVDQNMPKWAHEAVNYFINKGIIKGNGENLNLDDTKIWFLTVLYRLIKDEA